MAGDCTQSKRAANICSTSSIKSQPDRFFTPISGFLGSIAFANAMATICPMFSARREYDLSQQNMSWISTVLVNVKSLSRTQNDQSLIDSGPIRYARMQTRNVHGSESARVAPASATFIEPSCCFAQGCRQSFRVATSARLRVSSATASKRSFSERAAARLAPRRSRDSRSSNAGRFVAMCASRSNRLAPGRCRMSRLNSRRSNECPRRSIK